MHSVAVEACWRPMEGDSAGDFHEIVDLRDGRVAIVVGDAPGFGPAAAAVAEDLRAHLRRGFADRVDATAVLAGIDVALDARDEGLIATAACAVVDPDGRSVDVVNAGHLPLLVVDGSGVELLDGPADPPLGITAPRRVVRRELRDDTALFLYTDGLIERRGTPLDESLDALVVACAGIGGARAWASEVARRATRIFGQPTDDATVVSLRLSRSGTGVAADVNGSRVRTHVTLRVYVDPRDLRARRLEQVVGDVARLAKEAADVHIEIVDVTSPWSDTEEAGVLAAPTIVRVAPEPQLRVIGWFESATELAEALQVPVSKENP